MSHPWQAPKESLGEPRRHYIGGPQRLSRWQRGWFVLGNIALRKLILLSCTTVILRYNAEEARNLKAYGELPETGQCTSSSHAYIVIYVYAARINETDTLEGGEDDIPFEFSDTAGGPASDSESSDSEVGMYIVLQLQWL